MKKIILLILIVVAIPVIIIEDTSKAIDYYENYPNLSKDENWEKVKKTIFNNRFNPEMKVQRFNGPILISLRDASPNDSMLVYTAILKLKDLLPHKTIDYFENYTGLEMGTRYDHKNTTIKGHNLNVLESLTLRIHFNDSLKINNNLVYKKELETSIDREYTYYDFYESLGVSGLWKPKLNFDLNYDSSVGRNERIVEFGIIKVLACKNEFLGILDMYETSVTSEKRMDEVRFLTKNLYNPNLYEEFKTYLYETYPWRYASNYLNKEKTKVLAIWVCVALAVVLGMLGFVLLYQKQFKFPYLNYFLPILYFSISVLYCFKLYKYITAPYSFEHWRQYISIHGIIIIIAALLALFLFLFDKYLIKNNISFTMQFILKTGFTCLICMLPLLILDIVDGKNSQWYQINPILLLIFIFTFGRAVLLYLEYFSQNLIKQKDLELSSLKAANAQAEVKLLQSQINPHFLYNSLNSIASLAQKDAAKTEKMALSLSDLFKYTINRKGRRSSTVGDEVEMVKNYLEVEQIRFGDRLNFSVEVDESLNSLKIPMFLIQPLVENAIKHGISKIENDGWVQLKIYRNQHDLIIKVMDNGPHFPNGLVSGHGLQTVHDLLKLSYGDNATINTQNHPEKGITITIKNIA